MPVWESEVEEFNARMRFEQASDDHAMAQLKEEEFATLFNGGHGIEIPVR